MKKLLPHFYKFILFSTIFGLFFSGVSLQEVYAPGPKVMSIALQYTGIGGLLVATDKDGVPHIVTIGAVSGTSIIVATGDVVVITPGPGTKNESKGELDTETLITVGGSALLKITIPGNAAKPQVVGENLHTSCSKDIVPNETTVSDNDHSLLVVGTFGADGFDPCNPPVITCGFGTILNEQNQCVCEQQNNQCVGGLLLDTDRVSLLASSVGIDPLITGLVGLTIGGLAVQAVWFVHRRKKKN